MTAEFTQVVLLSAAEILGRLELDHDAHEALFTAYQNVGGFHVRILSDSTGTLGRSRCCGSLAEALRFVQDTITAILKANDVRPGRVIEGTCESLITISNNETLCWQVDVSSANIGLEFSIQLN